MNLLSLFVPTTFRFAYERDLKTSSHSCVHHSQLTVSWVVASDELELPLQNGWERPCLKHMNLKERKIAT